MLNISPEKSPDLLQRPKFTKLRSPERSPILTRRSRSHERSPERARHLRQLKHRSLEIPSVLSRSPDIGKRRSHYHEGSSESDERLLDQASTPIPIPFKPPASHSPSSSETTPEKSSPQGDDTIIEGHVKTESEDSIGGSEAVTPKLEEPPTDLGKPDRSASVTGEIEQLPPLPEETLLSPDVISPSLKVASAEKQKGMGMSGSETSKSLDNEQLLFDMLDNKEGSTEVIHDVSNEPQSQDDHNIGDTVKDDKKAMVPEEDQHEMDRTEKSEGADDILAELDELDVILDAEEEEEEEGEEEEQKQEMEIHRAKLEETDTGGKEKKEPDGAKLDRTDVVDGGEKEEHQELDKPICEESDIPPDSAIPKQIESENEPPVEVEGSPPEAEPPGDLESKPPETTIEVTEDNKHEPSTEVESAIPSQVQVQHVESPPESEPKPPEEPPTMEDVKVVVPAPPSVELELQVEPGIEPVPTNVDSEQPDIGHELQESKPESSEAEGRPPEVRAGQPGVEGESQSVEPEPVGTMHEPSLVEPSEDKLEASEDIVEPQEDKPEQPEVAAKEEPSELPEVVVNTSAEPTHLSQELESTICHKEPPESSSKSVDTDTSNEASVCESCGDAEKQIANSTEEQDVSIDNDGRTTEDSPVKSEGQSDQSPTKSEGQSDQSPTKSEGESDQSPTKSGGHSDQSPTKSEGESDQSPTRSEGESDQVVIEEDKAKREQSLKKEDSVQESEER